MLKVLGNGNQVTIKYFNLACEFGAGFFYWRRNFYFPARADIMLRVYGLLAPINSDGFNN